MCWQKLKQESRFLSPYKFAAPYKSELKLQLQQNFSDLEASGKETLLFQNTFNCAIEKLSPILQLEVINLQCNDMLKGKHQKKNLIEFC